MVSKYLSAAWAFCFLLAAGCDESPPTEPAPQSAGGKADEATGDATDACGGFEANYVACLDGGPDDTSCEAILNDEHPDAAECCSSGDEFAFCDLTATAWCTEVVTEHLECSASGNDECEADARSSHPIGALCGEKRFSTCDDVAAEYERCDTTFPLHVSCFEFIAEEFPGGGVCCSEDDPEAEAPEMCEAF